MSERARLAATLAIWIAFAIITASTLTSPTGAIAQASGVELFGIVLTMAIAAMVSTVAVWAVGWRATAADQDTASAARSKPKRVGRDRVERLIEDLDDDEIYDLEALLLARDQSNTEEGS